MYDAPTDLSTSSQTVKVLAEYHTTCTLSPYFSYHYIEYSVCLIEFGPQLLSSPSFRRVV